MTLKTIWHPGPQDGKFWTVWCEALVDPVSAGTEEHCKSSILERRVKVDGDPAQVLRSPAGEWFKWDGREWVTRPEGGAVAWCEIDDCPAVTCPHLGSWPGSGPRARCLA